MHATGRILTVCLNPAVDVIYLVDRFQPGREHDVRELTRVAGGKANNVARVAAVLGHQAVATGLAGGATGQFIERSLQGQAVEERLRMAVACGTANAVTAGVAEVDLVTVGQLVRQVAIQRLP